MKNYERYMKNVMFITTFMYIIVTIIFSLLLQVHFFFSDFLPSLLAYTFTLSSPLFLRLIKDTLQSKTKLLGTITERWFKDTKSSDKISKLPILTGCLTSSKCGAARPCAHTNGESQSLGHPQKSKFISFITDGAGRELLDISAARRGA